MSGAKKYKIIPEMAAGSKTMTKKILNIIMCLIVFPALSFADGTVTEYEKATINAENTWTDALSVQAGQPVDVSIYDYNATTSDMTIVLQRKFYEETSWGHEIDSWTLPEDQPEGKDIEHIAKPSAEFCYYRIGCPSGNFTSGSVKVRIGREKR